MTQHSEYHYENGLEKLELSAYSRDMFSGLGIQSIRIISATPDQDHKSLVRYSIWKRRS